MHAGVVCKVMLGTYLLPIDGRLIARRPSSCDKRGIDDRWCKGTYIHAKTKDPSDNGSDYVELVVCNPF